MTDSQIVEAVKNAVVYAGSTFKDDKKNAYRRAIANENGYSKPFCKTPKRLSRTSALFVTTREYRTFCLRWGQMRQLRAI